MEWLGGQGVALDSAIASAMSCEASGAVLLQQQAVAGRSQLQLQWAINEALCTLLHNAGTACGSASGEGGDSSTSGKSEFGGSGNSSSSSSAFRRWTAEDQASAGERLAMQRGPAQQQTTPVPGRLELASGGSAFLQATRGEGSSPVLHTPLASPPAPSLARTIAAPIAAHQQEPAALLLQTLQMYIPAAAGGVRLR
jgi:hypothetical protein